MTSGPGVSLVRAGRADFPALQPLMAQFYAETDMDFAANGEGRSILPLLESDDWGQVFWIAAEGRRTGYVATCFGYSIEFGGREANLDELFILPAHRRKGIAKGALTALVDRVQAAGCVAVNLDVADDNGPARAMYDGLGFAPRPGYAVWTRYLKS